MSKPNTYHLDYLFIAECENGNIIKQTPDDISRLDPTKSAFYDVLQNLPIKRFSLIGKGHIFTVHFSDGSYEIDGKKSLYGKRPPQKGDIKPIYYRQVKQIQSMEIDREKARSIFNAMKVRIVNIGEKEGLIQTRPIETKIRYYMGWQTRYLGKNYKFEMGID